MKKNLSKKLLFPVAILALASCNNDDEVLPLPLENEFEYIRILVNDELTNEVSLVDPVELSTESFQALFPKSTVYGTEAGRYGALVHRANNRVQFFDSGFESHGDHADVMGAPGFATLIGESNLPTHFKSKGNEVLTFNDGDGTLSSAKESDMHTSGAKMKTINTGNTAHHGAMAKFDNGSYAITEKDGSVAGALPERVKIIDALGTTLFASTIQTKGIHGNASDGRVALFGSRDGVLMVESTGVQSLIPHPANFGTAWLGSIYETNIANKFVGYTGSMGAYLIDVATKAVTPIIESSDLIQIKIDYAGNNLVALFHSGEVSIYDLITNTMTKNGTILENVAKDEIQKPQIEATSRYLYITQPKAGEVWKVSINDFTKIDKIEVSSTPYRMAILGLETDEGHD
ncbi:YncE family protein [Cyclobacterium xiamenense]|uniref:YncE family protein n=1 Tax=Cyclobacterium xiamenense TaxID=1297121 RepID=UPI0035D02EE1